MNITVLEKNTNDLQQILDMVNELPDKGEGYPETYDGTCVVTPDIEEQVLPTALKVMPSDVTVQGIPYSETPTANTKGTTFSIARF